MYHFTKDRGGGALEGAPCAYWRSSHADPQARWPSCGNPAGYRYAGYYRAKEREAIALIWVLRNLPLSLEIVRGLDICTDELGVPFWVLAPLLRAVRAAASAAVADLHRLFGIELPVLHTTVHAGEDFVHLLTGLRQVEEAIHLLDLREGDRIGHAMSLGVAAQDWAKRTGRVPVARETRLFDLAWEWSWYRRSGMPVPRRRRSLLEHEIARLSFLMCRERCELQDITQLVEDLHDTRRLWRMGFPDGPLPNTTDGQNSSRRDRLLRDYLTSPSWFRQGRVVEWVEPDAESDLLAEIQAGIRAYVSSRGLTVEVNPSSNLLIGDLADFARHPLWRLQNPGDDPESSSPVSVCIGSDDPLTFGTNLPQEYQLVYDALVLGGLSGEAARRWLENARARGLEARFTLPSRSPVAIHKVQRPAATEGSLLLRRPSRYEPSTSAIELAPETV